MYQIPVKHLLHAPVDIVRKPAHIKPLDVARALHESDHCHIRAHQKQHIGKNFFPCKYIQQALCKPSFKPRSREQSDIINQAGNRHRKQRLPLRHKVASDLIRFGFPILSCRTSSSLQPSFSPLPIRSFTCKNPDRLSFFDLRYSRSSISQKCSVSDSSSSSISHS